MKIAYNAYNDWLNKNGPEKQLPGLNYTSQQMFWIGAANAWCSKSKPERIKDSIINDKHSPNKFRIIGLMSDLPEFSNDFKCPLGSKMNPEKKCSFW